MVLLMDPFHTSGVLGSGSPHSLVNFCSSEHETTANVCLFLFPFAPIAKNKNKKQNSDSVFTTFQKREKV